MNSPINALVSGNAIFANATITSKMASAGAFCASPPSSDILRVSNWRSIRFNHYPQTDDIYSMIEHLYHHTLHTSFAWLQKWPAHIKPICAMDE